MKYLLRIAFARAQNHFLQFAAKKDPLPLSRPLDREVNSGGDFLSSIPVFTGTSSAGTHFNDSWHLMGHRGFDKNFNKITILLFMSFYFSYLMRLPGEQLIKNFSDC